MKKHSLRVWGVVAGTLALAAFFVLRNGPSGTTGHAAKAAAQSEPSAAPAGARQPVVRVRIVKPTVGGIERTTSQPGTVEAFEFADLFAKVSGYLSRQTVDIGAVVKRNQLLAEINVPELQEEVRRGEAALLQAQAKVQQMEARIRTSKADFKAAEAAVERSKSDLDQAVASRVFRKKQFERMQELLKLKSIDARLVDEKEEQFHAGLAAESAAEAEILTSRAQAAAAEARIASAEADLADSKAKVKLAEAGIAKAKVFVDYTRIVSPYDGVVTRRTSHLGDFIRAADQGGNQPLLTVARTDLMRVVVQVPERDVPFTNSDDAALVEVDALAGRKFKPKSRANRQLA